MIRCVVPDCERARRSSLTGDAWAMCDAHTCEAITSAFGPSWADRARTSTLPPLVVDGVSTTSVRHDRLVGGDVPTPPSRFGIASLQTAATTD